LHHIFHALDVTAGTKLGYVYESIHSTKVDECPKGRDSRYFAFAPFTDDQARKRLASSAVTLFTR
jgi:hypothetical protein